MQNDKILKLWGKADKDEAGNIIWHPLAYHMLDVAAVWSMPSTSSKLLYTKRRKATHYSERTHRKDLINQVLTMSPLTQLVQDRSMKKESPRG